MVCGHNFLQNAPRKSQPSNFVGRQNKKNMHAKTADPENDLDCSVLLAPLCQQELIDLEFAMKRDSENHDRTFHWVSYSELAASSLSWLKKVCLCRLLLVTDSVFSRGQLWTYTDSSCAFSLQSSWKRQVSGGALTSTLKTLTAGNCSFQHAVPPRRRFPCLDATFAADLP